MIAAFAAVMALAQPTAALGLRVAPIEYRTTLSGGEKKKGVVDITNPDAKDTIAVAVAAQGFRQINDKGDIEYYNDSKISAGLVPDFDNFTLRPHETMRMYFLLNGSKLPSGSVFAALVFRTQPAENLVSTGLINELRVGVLFSIVNGEPTDRQAVITGINVPFWQLSGTVSGSYSVKNTSNKEGAGFFPDVAVALTPFTRSSTVTSPLVFPGIERSQDFSLAAGRFGFYKVTVSFGSSSKEQWVFIAAAWQLRLLGLFVLVMGGVVVVQVIRLRKKRQHIHRKS